MGRLAQADKKCSSPAVDEMERKMKKLIVLTVIIFILTAAAAFCAKIGVIEDGKLRIVDNAPDPCYAVEGVKFAPVPEQYAGYMDKDGVNTVRIYEYNDAVVVEKTIDYGSPGLFVRINAPFFTGKADKYDWMSLPVKFPEDSEQDKCVKHGVYAERDKIYSVTKTDEGVRIVALITAFEQPIFTMRLEHVAVDTITPDMINGKTVILRNTVPAEFHQSSNVRTNVTPIPATAELLTDNIIRLRYDDGCIEHWKLTLTPEDVRKNTALYKGDNEALRKTSGFKALVWKNDKGEGNEFSDNAKAWDFDPDASREPVYEDQKVSVPETTASAKHMNVFSGLLARIGGFFRGLFGNA